MEVFMNIMDILYRVLLGPLLLLFETLFMLAYHWTGHPGAAIIALSLAMNLLVLPLYKKADEIQEEERRQAEKLSAGIQHIKKTFSGDERFMILQTYYNQNHYRPYYALRGSVSLLLEIPFFIAAYRFLSGLALLNGASLGPIADLSKPDGLVHILGFSVNVLPILMTGINILSGAIYTRGMPLRSKVQLYGMAMVFLVFLYDSPAGLVFYWTLNNVFSLVKNVVGALMGKDQKISRERIKEESDKKLSKKLFVIGCLFMTVLLGAYIPLTVIHASPAEFIDFNQFRNPLSYVAGSLALAVGIFLVWFIVFYALADSRGKKKYGFYMAAASVIAAVNSFFFGTRYGTMSNILQYHQTPVIPGGEAAVNAGVMLAVLFGVYIIWKKRKAFLSAVLTVMLCTISAVSIWNAWDIHLETERARETIAVSSRNETAVLPLSKTGNNVIVLMMDRAVGSFIEPILEEDPDLKRQFAGFTYYSNVLSYGGHTNIAAPALYGGYEYTPEEMDKRNNEPLQKKHDEALRVMPALFLKAGYDVTVCDPPLAGYSEIPDLSIYDDMDIHTYLTEGNFHLEGFEAADQAESRRNRNFFCYSIFRAMPLFFQPIVYDEGRYNAQEEISTVSQVWDGMHRAKGVDESFIRAYAVLRSFPEMVQVTEESKGCFLMLCNNTTHEPMLVQAPDYEPSLTVDNEEYDRAHEYWYEQEDRPHIYTEFQMAHYHANMAAMKQLGKWMDRLRELGVYDNTRIIIVSDHGSNLGLNNMELFGKQRYDLMYYQPLLLFKDFGAEEFSQSDVFMTNADTPTLALSGIAELINPFTGRQLTDEIKQREEQHVARTDLFDVSDNHGTTFAGVTWLSVGKNVKDPNEWKEMP